MQNATLSTASRRFSLRSWILAALLVAFVGGARAGPWTFYFVSQALEQLAQGAISRVLTPSTPAAPSAPPGWEVTLGTAELVNQKLPLSSSDGFAFMLARAPAPGALEIWAQAPTPAPSASELDAAWGPGLGRLFCSKEPSLWARWIAIGGTVGIDVKTIDGATIRRYGVSRTDCLALAQRPAVSP